MKGWMGRNTSAGRRLAAYATDRTHRGTGYAVRDSLSHRLSFHQIEGEKKKPVFRGGIILRNRPYELLFAYQDYVPEFRLVHAEPPNLWGTFGRKKGRKYVPRTQRSGREMQHSSVEMQMRFYDAL